MDQMQHLEQQWNDKIDLYTKQVEIQLQSFRDRIKNRVEHKQRLASLTNQIRELTQNIELNKQVLAESESHPNFHQLQKEYARTKGEEDKLETERRKQNLQKLLEQYRSALAELDIERAQSLIEELEINDYGDLAELKDELIETIKKL